MKGRLRVEIEKYYEAVGKIKYNESHKEMMELFYPLLKILEGSRR